MTESDQMAQFAGPNAAYYTKVFGAIQGRAGLLPNFNVAAAVFGPLWAGMRGLSTLFLLMCFLDLVALSQITSGIWGKVDTAGLARVTQMEATIASRRSQATEALANGNSEAAATATKLADNLQKAADAARAEAGQSRDGAGMLAMVGVGFLLLVRLATGLLANTLYERRYSAWRGDHSLPHGAPAGRLTVTAVLVAVIYGITIYGLVAPTPPVWLTTFPADKALFSTVEGWIDTGFEAAYESGRGVFEGIRDLIRQLVEAIEVVLVGTPWPVVMLVICTVAWQLAGVRVVIFTAVALAYLGLFGLWELSMLTVALLGAASILCILFGIPLGIWFARSKTAFTAAQPVLDFMQTMPAFVYLIPVIAFFGTGKPPGIIATLIFGMPPVIRLTTLGLNGVPEDVKEAARAFGATEWQVLRGVELPLARASILAGVNQTILMCLSMVVIASLIGAQGLGSLVLQSLQYAAKGQGLLAGLGILLCAMVIDRIIQGSFHREK